MNWREEIKLDWFQNGGKWRGMAVGEVVGAGRDTRRPSLEE